jgi:hypothetical protein
MHHLLNIDSMEGKKQNLSKEIVSDSESDNMDIVNFKMEVHSGRTFRC